MRWSHGKVHVSTQVRGCRSTRMLNVCSPESARAREGDEESVGRFHFLSPVSATASYTRQRSACSPSAIFRFHLPPPFLTRFSTRRPGNLVSFALPNPEILRWRTPVVSINSSNRFAWFRPSDWFRLRFLSVGHIKSSREIYLRACACVFVVIAIDGLKFALASEWRLLVFPKIFAGRVSR